MLGADDLGQREAGANDKEEGEAGFHGEGGVGGEGQFVWWLSHD